MAAISAFLGPRARLNWCIRSAITGSTSWLGGFATTWAGGGACGGVGRFAQPRDPLRAFGRGQVAPAPQEHKRVTEPLHPPQDRILECQRGLGGTGQLNQLGDPVVEVRLVRPSGADLGEE